MNFRSYIFSTKLICIWVAVMLIVYSCSKSTGDGGIPEGTGEAVVSVNLTAAEYGDEVAITPSGSGSGNVAKVALNSASSDISTGTEENLVAMVPFSDGIYIYAYLTPVANNEKSRSVYSKKSEGNLAAAVATPLNNGVRYYVTVYNMDGTRQTGQEFTYSSTNTTAQGITGLDAGKSYIFVAHSINSTSSVPAITGTTLSTANLNNISADLMYYIDTIPLSFGQNNVNIRLKHMFAQVNTTLEVGTDVPANTSIAGFNQAQIGPSSQDGTLKISNGQITFNTVTSRLAVTPSGSTSGTSVGFNPLLVLANNATGTFTFANLSINSTSTVTDVNGNNTTGTGGTTKSNISIPGITVRPGVKYDLTLRLGTPCASVTTRPFEMTTASGGSTTYSITNYNRPTQSFMLDIRELDNSFRLRINGNSIIAKPTSGTGSGSSIVEEAQFEPSQTSGNYLPNMAFENGDRYGVGSLSNIWLLYGTNDAPLIRVVVSSTGQVTMYGRKTQGGEFFPLVPINGYSFRTITWAATNTINIDQQASGQTYLRGRISARRNCGT